MAKTKGGTEFEHHVVATRLRVFGSGNLQLSLTDLQNVQNQSLTPLPITGINRIEPTRLANFQSQRIRLKGKVTEMNEWFQITRIIIYAKPVVTEYPSLITSMG